jgi:hypothetical protein
VLIAAGAAVVVLVALIAAGAFSGGSSHAGGTASTGASTRASSHAKRTSTKSATHHASSSAAAGAASPSETNVVVLNGTETTGLAHHVASELTQMGYSKATALGGRPEGANQTTVVEYSGGHRADAAAVAHALGISTVQPLEGSASALAGSASVVVIVGQDKASSLP